MEKFARVDDVTGKGINEGFVFNDGTVVADEDEALKIVQEHGYNTLKESYDDEFHYWTEWNVEDDDEDVWYDEDGKEYTNCHKCGEETPILEEFTFCIHCLTHL